MKAGYVLLLVALLLFSACSIFQSPRGTQPPELPGINVFCLGKLPQPCSIDNLASRLAQASIATESLFKGNCISWTETIDKGGVKLYVTKDKIWLHTVIDQVDGAEPFLADLLITIASKYQLPQPQNCHLTDSIGITITNPDGTMDLARMQVPRSGEAEYYRLVLKQSVIDQYGVSSGDITMEMEDNQLYWLVTTQQGVQKVKAMTYRGRGGGFGCQ